MRAVELSFTPYQVLPTVDDAVYVIGTETIEIGGAEREGLATGLLAADGTTVWSKWFQVQGWSSSRFGSVVDPAGNLYLADTFGGDLVVEGHTATSTVNPGDPGLGGRRGQPSLDICLVKIDLGGEVEWLRRYGGVGDQTAQELLIAADGSLRLVAQFSGRMELGEWSLTSSRGSMGQDLAIVQLDANGVPTGAVGLERGGLTIDAAALDSAGNLVIAASGAFQAAPVTALPLAVGGGGVAKLDPSGQILWATSFDPTNAPTPTSVMVDGQDNVMVAASAYGANLLYGQALSDTGLVLVELGDDGEVRSVGVHGESDLTTPFDLAPGLDGGILLTGIYYGGLDFDAGGRLTSVPDGGWDTGDIFIAGLGPDGAQRFLLGAGGPGLDAGTSIAALTDGRVVTCGWLDPPLMISGTTLRQGGFVAWITPG